MRMETKRTFLDHVPHVLGEFLCRFILRFILLFFPYRLINKISSLLLIRELKQDVVVKVGILILETDYVYIGYFHTKNNNRNNDYM